ncbi:MAG: T9SS type A sorting domain-containing protein [candidate division Zixibacteria bacterium]|nr:T9SS type A sorting domain-containing protein [Candidatus Tariuqbacter arcticus]
MKNATIPFILIVSLLSLSGLTTKALSQHFPYGKCIDAEIDADSTHEYDVLHYDLHIGPYFEEDEVWCTASIDFTPMTADFDTLLLHAEGLDISYIYDDYYDTLDFQIVPEGLEIYLNALLQPADTITIHIEYTAPVIPGYSSPGFHKAYEYCFTFNEPYGARKWFPCYDLPFDKATLECEIWVPSGYIAVSNGELVDVTPSGEYDIYTWREDDPITTYLISIAAGPYLELTDFTSDSIPLHYYVYPEDSAAAVYDFANTPDMVEFFSEIFGPYPFQMYGMAEAHLFNGWGAMEHQSVTTYGLNLINGTRQYEYIVSHELAHMWWGDCLSPLTFAEIWLNEGFATYSEALYIEARYDTLREHMENKAYSYFWEDQNQLRYPIYDPPPGFLFGSAVYCKGGWVLHMLRNVIGDSAFFAGLQNYHAQYAYGNVTTPEFQAEMEAVYGDDLGWFFDEWVYEAGFPEYDYNWMAEYFGGDYIITFNLEQVQSNAPVFTMPVDLMFNSADAETVITVWNDQQYQQFQFTVEFPPAGFSFDPEAKILKWDIPLGIEPEGGAAAASFALGQNYPNPFNPSTTIRFDLPYPSKVRLEIYNILGQRVVVLVDEIEPAGYRSVVWNSRSDKGVELASGLYIYRLKAEALNGEGKFASLKKMMLIK